MVAWPVMLVILSPSAGVMMVLLGGALSAIAPSHFVTLFRLLILSP